MESQGERQKNKSLRGEYYLDVGSSEQTQHNLGMIKNVCPVRGRLSNPCQVPTHSNCARRQVVGSLKRTKQVFPGSRLPNQLNLWLHQNVYLRKDEGDLKGRKGDRVRYGEDGFTDVGASRVFNKDLGGQKNFVGWHFQTSRTTLNRKNPRLSLGSYKQLKFRLQWAIYLI